MGEIVLKMPIHGPEADFGKLRIWRPKEVLYRYAPLVTRTGMRLKMPTYMKLSASWTGGKVRVWIF